MSRAKGRAFWERVVSDAVKCGSQNEAARRHGVSASGLGYWMRKLRAELAPTVGPRLLPVRIAGPVAVHRCGLVLGDLRLEFDEGTDPGYLAALAKGLREC